MEWVGFHSFVHFHFLVMNQFHFYCRKIIFFLVCSFVFALILLLSPLFSRETRKFNKSNLKYKVAIGKVNARSSHDSLRTDSQFREWISNYRHFTHVCVWECESVNDVTTNHKFLSHSQYSNQIHFENICIYLSSLCQLRSTLLLLPNWFSLHLSKLNVIPSGL